MQTFFLLLIVGIYSSFDQSFSETNILELQKYAARLSPVRSRIHQINRLKADLLLVCAEQASVTICENDETVKNRFFGHMSMWENPVHMDAVLWADEALRTFSVQHSPMCLNSLFAQYIRDFLSNEPAYSQVQSAIDFSNLLKMRSAVAARDTARLQQELRMLHGTRFRLSAQLRRYMVHFLPLITYLESFSFSDENTSHPTNETLAILESLVDRTEPILRQLMNIADVEPFWFPLPSPVIAFQFNQLQSEVARSVNLSRKLIWEHVFSPLFTSLRIDPEIRTRDIADLDSRIERVARFSNTVYSYFSATHRSILRIDPILNELISFGFTPTGGPL